MGTTRTPRGGGRAKKQPGEPKKPRRTARRARREEAAKGAIEAAASRLDDGGLDARTQAVAEAVVAAGGVVVGALRDPLAGRPLLLCSLPLDRVEPTPYQRQVSPAHVERLADAITRTGLYLDPIIAFHEPSSTRFHTPNGGHRTEAMRRIGARAITALVVPDPAIAFRILALNTEKAHNLRERSLEVAAMARALLPLGGSERDYAPYFEEPSLLTLGLCYAKRPRLSGAVWYPVVRRLEAFVDEPLREAMALRERHADELLVLDDQVGEIVDRLKAGGLSSPYLRTFVVARINPLRWAAIAARKKAQAAKAAGETRPARGKGKAEPGAEPPPPSWEATLEKMRRSAEKFDTSRIQQGDLAAAAGPPDEE